MNDIKKREERILRFSFLCSLALTASEVVMALILRSYSVLMDGIYDSSELILMGPFLVLVPLLYKPVTEKRPYGYAQFESVFLIVKYGILLMVTILMIYSNIQVILSGGHHIEFNKVALYEMIIGLLCVVVYLILHRFCRKRTSPTVASELFLWKQDIVGSIGLTIAFAAEYLLQGQAAVLAPYADSVVAIVLAVLLLREPVTCLIREFRELVLFAPDDATMEIIRGCVEDALLNYSYTCSFLDVIRTGRKYWVEIYVMPDHITGMVDVRHWASIREQIHESLEAKIGPNYVELIPDIPDHAVENRENLTFDQKTQG
ncbi:MAG: cation transporter [Eubacterium sp.]|nr:cation transporter [Eubacterium sp.]